MPSKNVIKTYIDDGYYHIYNRGVDKRDIFMDEQDYKVMLSYLKEYLSPAPDYDSLLTEFTLQGESFQGIPYQRKNYYGKIDLLAYCLMPNHFHLLIKQNNAQEIELFLRSLATRYVNYFNKKYKRQGTLFQGPYKAILVENEVYLVYLSKYIHRNPVGLYQSITEAYSSYAEYLGMRNTNWINRDLILSFFNNVSIPELKKINTYAHYVEQFDTDQERNLHILGDLILE